MDRLHRANRRVSQRDLSQKLQFFFGRSARARNSHDRHPVWLARVEKIIDARFDAVRTHRKFQEEQRCSDRDYRLAPIWIRDLVLAFGIEIYLDGVFRPLELPMI